MRHRVAILAAACTMVLGALGIGVLPAAAADNCTNWNTCTWTQMNNGNWEPNSGMDPGCYSNCAQWTQDCSYRLAYYNDWSGQNNPYEHDIDWAVNTWNAVPECSPSYVKAGPNDSVSIVYDLATLSGDAQYACGDTFPTGYQWNGIWVITKMEVQLNTNMTYYDGPVPSNAPANSCNLKSTVLHETGHTLGEGHSSTFADVMYPCACNNATAIDADAHHMLAAIYGYPSGSACNGCQADLPGMHWGLPPIRQMGPAALEQTIMNKLNGASGSVNSAEQDSGSTVSNAEQGVHCVWYRVNGTCEPFQP